MAKKFSVLERIPWEQAYTAFIALEREKKWLAIAAISLFTLLLVFLPVSCASKRLGKLQSEYLSSQKNLALLAEKAEEYKTLKSSVDALEAGLSKGKDMSLSTVLDNLAKPVGFSNIDFKAASEPAPPKGDYDVQARKVEIKEASLASVVDYNELIRKSRQTVMTVDKLDVKTNRKNRALVDVTFVVTTITPKANAGAAAGGKEQKP